MVVYNNTRITVSLYNLYKNVREIFIYTDMKSGLWIFEGHTIMNKVSIF